MKKTTEQDRSKFFISKGLYKFKGGEVNDQPSETIQGEAYSIKDLVRSGVSNRDILERDHYFDLDEELDETSIDMGKIQFLDLSEKYQAITEISERIEALQKQAKKLIDTTKGQSPGPKVEAPVKVPEVTPQNSIKPSDDDQ